MQVTIRTPDAEVFAGPALSLSLITELGAIQIFPGHASLQGAVLLSPLRVEIEGSAEDFIIQRGFVLIDQPQNKVDVLVYRCEKRGELNHQTAKEYLQVLLKALESPENLGKYQLRHLEDEKIATEKYLDVWQKEKAD